MSDFEINGLNLLKQALTQMGRSPKTISRRDPMVLKLMEEIYVEVRQARISGYSWKDLKGLLSTKNAKIKLYENTVASVFQELDMKYEKENRYSGIAGSKETRR